MANHRRRNRSAAKTAYQSRTAIVETSENPHLDRDHVIETVSQEFAMLCPKTGQSGFGANRILDDVVAATDRAR
jgi:NADPH-dependent 7-cyano-7-deazaguanine reductase QueF